MTEALAAVSSLHAMMLPLVTARMSGVSPSPLRRLGLALCCSSAWTICASVRGDAVAVEEGWGCVGGKSHKFGCKTRSCGLYWGGYEMMSSEASDMKRVVALLVHALHIDAKAEKRANLVDLVLLRCSDERVRTDLAH